MNVPRLISTAIISYNPSILKQAPQQNKIPRNQLVTPIIRMSLNLKQNALMVVDDNCYAKRGGFCILLIKI
jgi:hypothetical protein